MSSTSFAATLAFASSIFWLACIFFDSEDPVDSTDSDGDLLPLQLSLPNCLPAFTQVGLPNGPPFRTHDTSSLLFSNFSFTSRVFFLPKTLCLASQLPFPFFSIRQTRSLLFYNLACSTPPLLPLRSWPPPPWPGIYHTIVHTPQIFYPSVAPLFVFYPSAKPS